MNSIFPDDWTHHQLFHWVTINNNPAFYMHEEHWHTLPKGKNLYFYKQDKNLIHGINSYIIINKGLQCLPLIEKECNADYNFWIDNFHLLPNIIKIINLVLSENPKRILHHGRLYRNINENFNRASICFFIKNHSFISRHVRDFLTLSLGEEIPSSLLIDQVSSDLKTRAELLFSVIPNENVVKTINFTETQNFLFKQLVKRIIKIISGTETSP